MFQRITQTVLALFSEFLDSEEGESLSNLLEAERLLSDFGRELIRELAQTYVDKKAIEAKASRGACRCGKRIPIHGETSWMRHGLAGKLRIRDPYCYCRQCGDTLRPLHAFLGTSREKWSQDLERLAVDLSADESCEKAVKKLGRMYPGVDMGRTTALQFLHKHGDRAKAFVQSKIDRALHEAEAKAHAVGGRAELEVEYDGGMIPTAVLMPCAEETQQRTPIRNLPKRRKVCEWKEAKVGLVQVPGEASRLYTARPTDELDNVFRDLLGLACLKGLGGDTQVRGIADGAPYIRKRLERTFENHTFQFILDRPHAKQHLYEAGERLHPYDEELRQAWVKQSFDELESGKASKVVARLRKLAKRNEDDELRKAADYFERNAHAVAYNEYRAKGWSTASSEVESGHRHVVQVRLKIPGAWWHPDNVSNILALRLLKANEGWWDEYWKTQDEAWGQQACEIQAARQQVAA